MRLSRHSRAGLTSAAVAAAFVLASGLDGCWPWQRPADDPAPWRATTVLSLTWGGGALSVRLGASGADVVACARGACIALRT